MIKITKQLQRPDGGTVSANSIIDYNTKFVGINKTLNFFLTHYFNQSAFDEGKEKIPAVINFKYVQVKKCTDEEWLAINTEPNAGIKTQEWLEEILTGLVGVGNTEII